LSVRFQGKNAIVTGAASGIGREIASQLRTAGAHVLTTDLPGTDVDMAVDVTSSEQLQAAVDTVVERHGRLDLMFNNAGVAIFGELELVTLADWDRIIDVNFRGVAYGTTIAYAQMVRQGGGRIVNTASVAGLAPVPLQAHYCATKHAIVGLGRTVNVEARRHRIRVVTFCPAFVETPMFDNNSIVGSLGGVDPRKLVPLRPLPAATAVQRLLEGVDRGRELVITPSYGRVVWWLERLSPSVSGHLQRLALRQSRWLAGRLRRRGASG
jgi:NAD(P)-dependent dehydrogenase (short-subunit alcohol dehydrogenase family)